MTLVETTKLYLSLLSSTEAAVLVWAEQFIDPSPALYVSDLRHWRKFFEPLKEKAFGQNVVVIFPENLSGARFRALSGEARRILIPLRPDSVFHPRYGDLLYGREFVGPTILVMTHVTGEIRRRYGRPIPAEPMAGILSPDKFPLTTFALAKTFLKA